MLYRSRESALADISNMSLYAANIAGGDPMLLETGLTFDSPFRIDGGIAVWAVQKPDGIHISARDLGKGIDFAISTKPGGAPQIHAAMIF